MNDPFHELLDATIHRLDELKSRGVKYVPVSPTTLAGFDAPTRSEVDRANIATADDTLVSSRELSATPDATPPIEQPKLCAEEKEKAIAHLKERALACVKCQHLVRSRKNVVFGVGSIHADLIFVGEAPGVDEDREGEPFVGKAGQLLTRIIEAMGLQRSQVYIANVLKCRPDTPGQSYGNRKPTPSEMQTCRPFLMEQIRLIRPKVVVALGGTAVEGLLNSSGVYITKMRGRFLDFNGLPLMPTYHPSYVLRNSSNAIKRQIWEDMLQVMEKLGMSISEKQRRFFTKSK